ncbi:hypothetical protein COLO4_27871 [Corchorus olitorius]|uniref:Uncharacterized protein n=1 Tax=Corchorus olitorius TaxID=93759 RepID=A0A1R3HNU5_9ROSI|nr:hypothetical protein COLO4_27871 [Corchorus olitorius]
MSCPWKRVSSPLFGCNTNVVSVEMCLQSTLRVSSSSIFVIRSPMFCACLLCSSSLFVIRSSIFCACRSPLKCNWLRQFCIIVFQLQHQRRVRGNASPVHSSGQVLPECFEVDQAPLQSPFWTGEASLSPDYDTC